MNTEKVGLISHFFFIFLEDKIDRKKLILSMAMIVLLPLLPALMYVGYKLIPIIMKNIGLYIEMLFGMLYIWMIIIILGIPAALIIYYGYTTGDKIISTLSGAFLIPLFSIYSEILFELVDPHFIMSSLSYWLRWGTIIDFTPPTLICGLMGYFASRRTKASFSASIGLGILLVFMFVLID